MDRATAIFIFIVVFTAKDFWLDLGASDKLETGQAATCYRFCSV